MSKSLPQAMRDMGEAARQTSSILMWGSPTPDRWYEACQASLVKSACRREAVRHRVFTTPVLIITALLVVEIIIGAVLHYT